VTLQYQIERFSLKYGPDCPGNIPTPEWEEFVKELRQIMNGYAALALQHGDLPETEDSKSLDDDFEQGDDEPFEVTGV